MPGSCFSVNAILLSSKKELRREMISYGSDSYPCVPRTASPFSNSCALAANWTLLISDIFDVLLAFRRSRGPKRFRSSFFDNKSAGRKGLEIGRLTCVVARQPSDVYVNPLNGRIGCPVPFRERKFFPIPSVFSACRTQLQNAIHKENGMSTIQICDSFLVTSRFTHYFVVLFVAG